MRLTEKPVTSELPCAEALIADTVALMTTWADPCPHCSLPPAERRALMARKIVSNLFFLKSHPALSQELRQVMDQAHQLWVPLTQVPEPPTDQPAADLPATSVTAAAMTLH